MTCSQDGQDQAEKIAHSAGAFEAALRVEMDRRMAATPALLHSINESGLIVSVSDAWLAKLGYRREEVLGRHYVEFLTPDSRALAIDEVLPRFLREGRIDDVPYRVLKKGGGVIEALISGVFTDDPGGHGRVSLSVVSDISALVETRRNLLASEARYRGLVEDQSDLVSLAAPDGELRYVNEAYATHYGRRPHEMVGKNLLDFVPDEEACGGGQPSRPRLSGARQDRERKQSYSAGRANAMFRLGEPRHRRRRWTGDRRPFRRPRYSGPGRRRAATSGERGALSLSGRAFDRHDPADRPDRRPRLCVPRKPQAAGT